MTYIGAAEHADNAAEKARMAKHHVAEGTTPSDISQRLSKGSQRRSPNWLATPKGVNAITDPPTDQSTPRGDALSRARSHQCRLSNRYQATNRMSA